MPIQDTFDTKYEESCFTCRDEYIEPDEYPCNNCTLCDKWSPKE